ncbi:hypothetical protein LCGC14_2649920, partial [marine sediment metagenome]
MLGAMSEHISWWMVVLIFAVFFPGWLWGGGYLFRKSLLKHSQKRRITLGRGILVSFLSGLTGAIAGGVIYLVGKTAWPPPPESTNPVSIWGIILAVPTFAIIAYLVVFSMSRMSVGKTLKTCAWPLVSTIILSGIIGTVCGLAVDSSIKKKVRQNRLIRHTMENFVEIFEAIMRKDPTDPPASLEGLVGVKDFDPKVLQNPANPSGRGYFYVPTPLVARRRDVKKKILVCDFREDSVRDLRIVLFNNGIVED